MANLKDIRKRISSVKSTQKITRAMKMVAGARLNRAQQRIISMRPYAVQTGNVLREVTRAAAERGGDDEHPLLKPGAGAKPLYLVITSDRGLCGAFNSNILRRAEQLWRSGERDGKIVQIATIGRKGRDYMRRREAPIYHVFDGVWDDLGIETTRRVAKHVLGPFLKGEVDSIQLVYNEFKSAMSQNVVVEPLFPLSLETTSLSGEGRDEVDETVPEWARQREFIFEPSKGALMEVLVPMYIEITVLRALLESMASELGARMTAMDAATKNASEMIAKLTLQYNRARQAAITTELMEIIGGAEALNG